MGALLSGEKMLAFLRTGAILSQIWKKSMEKTNKQDRPAHNREKKWNN